MSAIKYIKTKSGRFKKVKLIEKSVGGKLMHINPYELLKGEDGRSIIGATGIGLQGIQGLQGESGKNGIHGLPGYTPIKYIDYFDGEIGPTGSQGEQGPQGPIGLQGIQGLQGERGERGDKGDRGERGERGLQGPIGLQGLQGEVGPQGLKGDTGPRGLQGLIGPQGEQGIQGPTGATGPRGRDGERGKNGMMGPMGPKGDTGPQGPPGSGGTSSATSEYKSGQVDGSLFVGTDTLYYDVVFTTPFSTNVYAISIIGEEPRSWSIHNKTATGFRIESNSSSPLTGEVYWICSQGDGNVNINNRRGIVANTAWYDTVLKADILFSNPMTGVYSISIMGEDVRTWSVENLTNLGFTIKSNSSESISGNTYWQCIEI
jgi:hypothetical protein